MSVRDNNAPLPSSQRMLGSILIFFYGWMIPWTQWSKIQMGPSVRWDDDN